MKNIKSKNIGMCMVLASMLLSLSGVNFVSADNDSSSESSSTTLKDKIFLRKEDKNEVKKRLNEKKRKLRTEL